MGMSTSGEISRESPAALAALVGVTGRSVPGWAGKALSGWPAGAFRRGPGGKPAPGAGAGAGASAGACGLVDGPGVGSSRMVTPRDLLSARPDEGMPMTSAPAMTTWPMTRSLAECRMAASRCREQAGGSDPGVAGRKFLHHGDGLAGGAASVELHQRLFQCVHSLVRGHGDDL